jgi:hypothetical protein
MQENDEENAYMTNVACRALVYGLRQLFGEYATTMVEQQDKGVVSVSWPSGDTYKVHIEVRKDRW